MSESAATSAAVAAAESIYSFTSIAKADVDENNKAAEDVFLSMPYKKEITIGDMINEYTFYCIAVLVHCKEDMGRVSAAAYNLDDEGLRRVRVCKPTYPAFFYGNKQQTVTRAVFQGEEEAATAFSQSVFANGGSEPGSVQNTTVVDVHLPKRINQSIRKINQCHLSLTAGMLCSQCHVKQVLEIPNVIAYEVMAVDFAQSGQRSYRTVDDEVDVSE